MHGFRKFGVIDDFAVFAGVLNDYTYQIALVRFEDRGVGDIGFNDFDAETFCSTSEDCGGLGVHVFVDDEGVLFHACAGVGHCHCFSGSRALIEKRCVCQGKACKLGDDSLKIQQTLQAACRQLRSASPYLARSQVGMVYMTYTTPDSPEHSF